MTDDPIGDALRREFASTFVPYNAARADDMLAAVHAAPIEGPRWVAPLAAAAVVAVVGGGAAAIGFHGSGDPAPAGGGGAPSSSSSCEVAIGTGYAYPATASDLPLPASPSLYTDGPLTDGPYTASDLPSAGSSSFVPPPTSAASAKSDPASSGTAVPGTNRTVEVAPDSKTGKPIVDPNGTSVGTAEPAITVLPVPTDDPCVLNLPNAVASCVPEPSPTGEAGDNFAYSCGYTGYAPLPGATGTDDPLRVEPTSAPTPSSSR